MQQSTAPHLQPAPSNLAMAPPPPICHYGAYFAMKEANGDLEAAKRLYDKWLADHPVSKWKQFFRACFVNVPKGILRDVKKALGRKPKITTELALKIGTVYAQRQVWEHGKPRHYRDMGEVWQQCTHGTRAYAHWPATPPNPPVCSP